MRILVVGAGSTGGYFGGRLHAAGENVTFLVRERRARQLKATGLQIRSPLGDLHIENPNLILSSEIVEPFDLIILSCKAYDLEDAATSFAAAVASRSVIVPLLNGMRHLDVLDRLFGSDRVFGGQCMITAKLDDNGAIVQLSPLQTLTFGPRSPNQKEKSGNVIRALENRGFEAIESSDIEQDMWEKWVFIAVHAGITTLMRASIGDIVAAGGSGLTNALLDECLAIAAKSGRQIRDAAINRTRELLTAAGSTMSASMLRDIEAGTRIESDQIIGDFLARADGIATPLLQAIYVNLRSYENRRMREAIV